VVPGSGHRPVGADGGPLAHRLRGRNRDSGPAGQVEGCAPSGVPAWLATTPKSWREQIAYVAIDMSPGYRAAVPTGLPHATVS
jgi:hypothetical protein